MSETFTAGRVLIAFANVLYSAGAFIFDFNETHVRNPRWPPHAKFHNGQTMTLGTLLAATSLYFLLKPASTMQAAKENVFHAALIGTFYCAAGLSAILYPGTAWDDPEYDQGGGQRYLFSAICAFMWIGYGLELRRFAKAKKA